MDEELRRKICAYITSQFLNNNKNRNNIDKMLDSFAKYWSNNLGNGQMIYLKGGNAFSVLNGETLTGDYDFQFVPAESDYADWSNKFESIDKKIMNSFLNVLSEDLEQFDTSVFEVKHLTEWASKNIREADFARVERDIIMNDITKTGEGLGNKKYDYMKKKEKEKSKSENFNIRENKAGLKIVVTYKIPGFILYRILFEYRYKYSEIDSRTNQEKSFYLYSEIFDVSVPRCGSPELYIMGDGVLTHFHFWKGDEKSKKGIQIPGWGYHFYENINILQENLLGICNSPDKVMKRQRRLDIAISKLHEVNESLLGPIIIEPWSDGGFEIMGYIQALTNIVGEYVIDGGITLIDPAIINNLHNYIFDKILSDWNKALESKKVVSEAEQFVQFRINPEFDVSLLQIKDIIDAYEKLTKPCLNFINNASVFIPFALANPKKWLIDLTVIVIRKMDYEKFLNYIETSFKEAIVAKGKTGFALKLQGYEYCITFQCWEKEKYPDKRTTLPALAKRSLLMSQKIYSIRIMDKKISHLRFDRRR